MANRNGGRGISVKGDRPKRRFKPANAAARYPIEALEARAVPAVIGTFANGVLSVFGDALDNTITVSRNAAGNLLVNGGAVAISGGAPTVANTALIQVFGQAGNDTITLDESNGALPSANLFGGAGNDVLTGGSGNDQLFGQAGNDTLLGKGGVDFLFGGADNDVLTGGDGDDQVFGESGDDRMVWNPGDDTDLNEGGAGVDTVEVNGGNGAEAFTVTANGARVRFDRVNPAPFAIDIGTSENLVLNANGGDDTFSATGNLAALIQITVDGGAGNDTIFGSNGADVLIGGDGDDLVDGQQGNDVAFLGAGNDAFVWDPGDGSDVVEGQGGSDTMVFNGSAGGEVFDLSANGGRLRFFRNLGNIVMDTNDLEVVQLNALGGADTIVLNDLSGTDVQELRVDLGVNGAGDNQIDHVILNGTNGDDFVEVLGSGSSMAVVGLPTFVSINHVESVDTLTVNTLGGDDQVSASSLTVPVKLVLDGGAGDDVIFGSRFTDILLGGDGDDFVDGNGGDDLALLGDGDDVFVWDPGDGSDVVEGQGGTDAMTFNGSNANESFDLSANGGRFRLFRNVGNIVMDTDDLERVQINAFGGADTITVGDLSGTDVNLVRISLIGGSGQKSDLQEDRVVVNGTNGDDVITAATPSREVVVSGLQATVRVTGLDAGLDRLDVNALGGADVVDASGLSAKSMKLSVFGGDGDDLLIGSDGADFVVGGRGNDVAFLGAGNDTFVWNPGDGSDVLEGQAGLDEMVFNGANVAENIDISANGGRLRFFRNVGNITMDANDLEIVTFNALGGADTVTVGDLSGTDVNDVRLDLGAQAGGGQDGQPDRVIVLGTGGDDVISLASVAGETSITGLAARVSVRGSNTNDRIEVKALGGDDVIEAAAFDAALALLVLEGGDGDDVLIGSDGDDVLDGGPGDDVLIGGDGVDVLLNGEVVIQ